MPRIYLVEVQLGKGLNKGAFVLGAEVFFQTPQGEKPKPRMVRISPPPPPTLSLLGGKFRIFWDLFDKNKPSNVDIELTQKCKAHIRARDTVKKSSYRFLFFFQIIS